MVFDWTKYIRKDGYLNTKKFNVLRFDPDYITLQNTYPWTKCISELYFCDKNNITEQPKCYCGKFVKYEHRKYAKCCSNRCHNTSVSTGDKRKETNLQKYGHICNLHSTEGILKKTETWNKNLGVSNPLLSHVVKNKIKETNLKNLGVENPFASDTVKNKIKETNLKNLGVENPSQSDKIKYLKECAAFSKCGRNHLKQAHITLESLSNLNDPEWLRYQHYDLRKFLTQIAKQLDVSSSSVQRKFEQYGIQVIYFPTSVAEHELYDYVKSIYCGYVISNDRSMINPYELDIYIPELNLAFEYDGTYWHGNTRERDRQKSFKCKKLGITLYHIHERYWKTDQNKVKRIILNTINKRVKI